MQSAMAGCLEGGIHFCRFLNLPKKIQMQIWNGVLLSKNLCAENMYIVYTVKRRVKVTLKIFSGK
jgi:hypothetical protein